MFGEFLNCVLFSINIYPQPKAQKYEYSKLFLWMLHLLCCYDSTDRGRYPSSLFREKYMKDSLRLMLIALGLSSFVFCGTAFAGGEGDEMESLRNQVSDLTTELKELNERLDKTELHSATDKVSWGVDLRVRADSIHYENALFAPSSLTQAFFTPYEMGGFNGATLQQMQQAIGGMMAAGMVPLPEKRDIDNDMMWTNRLRLNMQAKVSEALSFSGRLTSYKVYGDGTDVKLFEGLNDVTLDGTTASLPRGDELIVERAFFDLKGDWGDVPVNFSFGRRPSTDGTPLQYLNNSLIGGSPLAHIINWQFDGASLGFGLEEATGLPGFQFKLCYGVGYEGGWGSGIDNQVDDVNLAGFIAQLYDDGYHNLTLNYAHAFDVTDGFAGETVQPFYASVSPTGAYTFTPNAGGFISRIGPMTNIGDWDAADLLWTADLEEMVGADVDFFLSAAWSHTDPTDMSNIPFYQILGQGLLSSNGDLQARDGYSFYTGLILPGYEGGRLGFEYNYGSKYWFNFTGAEDSLVGSKLATRGNVFEAYYHQPIHGDNFFLTLGLRYYDYEYTGSGNPLGAPVKISDATALDTINPVVDKVLNGYLSATARF